PWLNGAPATSSAIVPAAATRDTRRASNKGLRELDANWIRPVPDRNRHAPNGQPHFDVFVDCTARIRLSTLQTLHSRRNCEVDWGAEWISADISPRSLSCWGSSCSSG